MTLPCPSNPAKAKKAAALKAEKEAKMKNPVLSPLQMLELAQKQEEEKEKPQPPQNNWYMGSYGDNDGKFKFFRRNFSSCSITGKPFYSV